LKVVQQKHAIEQQAALVQTSLGDWARKTNKYGTLLKLVWLQAPAALTLSVMLTCLSFPLFFRILMRDLSNFIPVL
jgi:hypothetical protein